MNIKELYSFYLDHPAVTTDSRNCPEGSIFIALKGASFDGNKFAGQALAKGCSLAVVDEKEYYVADGRHLLVDDCLTAYKELAREHRRHFSIPVIGITGTNGKTTTKELVSAVLARRYHVMHTEGNYNNDVGVPKTLLRLSADDDIAVVEMGASHPGDIDKLVRYVEPTCGLITNVGRAHLQGFGSFEGVKKTKGELYDYLSAHDGLLFLNAANADLSEMAAGRSFSRVITYGQGTGSDYAVEGHVTECAPFLNFEWTFNGAEPAFRKTYTVNTHVIGAYNIDNMLAAITAGLHFDVPAEDICDALAAYEPTNSRSELVRTVSNTLIVDAYNANPSSMKAAIDNFNLMQASGKMAILGDMRELGPTSLEEHQNVVNLLTGYGINDVWLVGSEFMKTKTPDTFRKFGTVEDVKAEIAAHKPQGRCILIKGSNGIRLFELPQLL